MDCCHFVYTREQFRYLDTQNLVYDIEIRKIMVITTIIMIMEVMMMMMRGQDRYFPGWSHHILCTCTQIGLAAHESTKLQNIAHRLRAK